MTVSPMDSDGAIVTAAPGIYPGPGSATSLRYWNGTEWDPRPVARTWTRVWCNAIDNVLASIVWIVLAFILLIPFVLLDPSGDNPLGSGISILGLIVGFVGYFSVSYRLWGRTPGMMLGRLYVVHISTGQSRLTWGTAIGRAAGLILGYACGIFTLIWLVSTASSRTKQGPHDSWARTGVLVDPPSGPGATHLVSGSAASLAAGRESTSADSPSSPPENPTAPGPAELHPQVQAEPEPVEGPATAAVRPGGVQTERSSNPADGGAASLAAPDDPQDLNPQVQHRRSRLPLVLGSVIAGVALVASAVFALLYVDSRLRANTLEELLAAAATSEEVIGDYVYEDRFAQLAEDLEEAKETQGRDQAFYDNAWADFANGTSEAARGYVAPLQRAILDVESVQPLPWHSDLIVARSAYLDYSNTWLEAVSARTRHTSQDKQIPNVYQGMDAEIERTWEIAQRRFQDISIRWIPIDLRNEVDRIF